MLRAEGAPRPRAAGSGCGSAQTAGSRGEPPLLLPFAPDPEPEPVPAPPRDASGSSEPPQRIRSVPRPSALFRPAPCPAAAAAVVRLLQDPARRPPRTSPRGDPAPTPAAPPWWAGGRPCASRAPPPSTPSSSATEVSGGPPAAPAARALRLGGGPAAAARRVAPPAPLPGRARPPAPLLSPRLPGRLVFADRPDGPPITLRARYILIRDGGELHIGSERCPYGSRATISLYGRAAEGAAVEGFGQKFVGVGRGGVLELHGRRPRSWTLLDKTLYPGGLRHGPYSSEKRWGSRGLNLRVLDGGTARVLAAGRFDTHRRRGECRRLRAFLALQAPGSVVAAAVGDSAARSLTLETRLLLRDRLGSRYIARLGYR